MKFMNTSPCFSGKCGFCANCCNNYENSCEVKKSEKSENIRRAEDLTKFMGKERIEKYSMKYNKEIKEWCKKNEYLNPKDRGWVKNNIKINQRNGSETNYTLCNNYHNIICDDSICKVIYLNTPEWFHSSFYSKLPIYERNDKLFNLCGICITRNPSPPQISGE
jgi:hypothetical protein